MVNEDKEEFGKKSEKEPNYIPPKPYMEPIPLPQRLSKAMMDKQFGRFLEI